jgi:hypothetical protein|tara:strand:+ start:904 stop:1116 length:213 start_codon:yes stop_codon:yes gene_type:complete
MLNINSLLKHIFEGLRSALRDSVSMQSLFEFLKKYTSKFYRQKRKRKYAMPPQIKSTDEKNRLKKYSKTA